MRLKLMLGGVTLATFAACGWRETRMEPASEYRAASRPTVSAAPAFTAGPDTVLTSSPDGSTLFVCRDGSIRAAGQVPARAAPKC